MEIKNRPNPNDAFPNPKIPSLCFIKNVVKNPRIIIGDYTYYDDVDGADQFEKHVTHFYDFIGDRLIIGKFCAIAKGVEFVMNGANHRMDGVTTYPFYVIGGDWGSAIAPVKDELPLKGDTVVGNDVWIGQHVTIMPGVHIGDGAIIGANSVVASDIPPYAIAVGNPCRVTRMRFDDEFIAYLLQLKWWDWDIEKIERNFKALSSGDLSLNSNLSNHMNIEDYREYCLSLSTDIEEKLPFQKFKSGEGVLVFYVMGHMFSFFDCNDFSVISLKCQPERIEDLKAQHECIGNPYNESPKHWIGVNPNTVPDELLKELTRNSYEIVKAKYRKVKK